MLEQSKSNNRKNNIMRIIFKSVQKMLKYLGRLQIPNSLMVNGNRIKNKICIAEIFNDFFVNVGSNLASRIPKGKKTF